MTYIILSLILFLTRVMQLDFLVQLHDGCVTLLCNFLVWERSDSIGFEPSEVSRISFLSMLDSFRDGTTMSELAFDTYEKST